jgi:hypothetical protein
MDKDIQKAIEIGEQNRATSQLVRNWCAHVRIVKHGGIGLIEQEYGLPIGHHGLACDYATAGGMYTWDMRDAALDFYDRNCVDCKDRKPVNVPNLSSLIKERDDQRATEARKVEAAAAQEAEARETRRWARVRLRDGLNPLSSAIVDHIDEFDDHRDQVHRDSLCESARLAPEHFVPAIVEYVFSLAERESWFGEAGLTILDHVKADPARMAKLALAPMGNTWPIDTHARVLLDRLSDVDATQIPDALPAIIELASPYDEFPLASERMPSAQPALLVGLWESHPAAVRDGIDRLLSSRRYYEVELASRGLIVLQERDPSAARPFLRTMVSKFSRAELLLDDFSENRSAFRHLRDALVNAFEVAPDEVDSLVQEYISASDRKSKDRAYKIYEAAMRGRRHDAPPIPPESRAHRLAFRRLLWASTTEESSEILDGVAQVFRGRPYEMIEIARAELDGLLGALLLLDDRLRRHDETQLPKNADMLQAMERGNRRRSITNLMESLVDWASIAAKDAPALAKKVVTMIEQIPEGRDYLKGITLGSIEHLGETVEGLRLMLPHLYYGLVGPSVVVRSYAATALGEAPKRNIPPLVYEAFSVLLWDQYVMVHKSAVDALGRLDLPENLRGRSAQALLNLIRYYAMKSNEDHFVVECVEQLAYELKRLGRNESEVGKYLVTVLLSVDPIYVKSKLSRLSHALGGIESFADLLIKMIPHVGDQDHWRDNDLDLLAELPEQTILARKEAFEKLGTDLVAERPWLVIHIIEALERVGAWAEARKVAEAGVSKPQPTIYNESRIIVMSEVKVSASFEEAIAEGRFDDLAALAQQWEETVKRKQDFNADVERRNSRSGFSRPI